MYHTTGFTKAEITELCARIEARELSPRVRRWPPILGLRNALTVTLTYLRRNRVQAEIAENYGVSQPTISRAISAITPLLVQALLDWSPAPLPDAWHGSPTRSLEAAMITIALENPECSSRPTRATGSAIKDTSATTCSRPSGSLKAANYWIGRRSSISRSIRSATS